MTFSPQKRFGMLVVLAVDLGLLYVIGLIIDWPVWLHGSNWVWVRHVPELGWWPLTLLLITFSFWLALLIWVWQKKVWSRGQCRLLLAILICFTPIMQLVILRQHQTQPLSTVFVTAVNFFQVGVKIEDPAVFIRDHAANMPHYRNVHVQTQPPGWQLAIWAAHKFWQEFPQAAESVGRRLLRYDCLSTDLQELTPAQIATATLQMSILFWSGLGVLPLYCLGRALFSVQTARLAAVAYPLMPGLLAFQARHDIFYALAAITALWLTHRLLTKGKWWDYLLLVLLLVGISILAFGPLAIILLVNGFMVAHIWLRARTWRGLRPFLAFNLLLLLGIGLVWGGFWLLWGASWPQMFRISQEIHHLIRINYPLWPLFNLYDFAVFLGLPLAVMALARGSLALRRAWRGQAQVSDAFILGWLLALIFLDISGQVRAETGRLWLFLMLPGLLVGVAMLTSGSKHRSLQVLLLLGLFGIQGIVIGLFLGGSSAVLTVPAIQWRLPRQVTATNYDLDEIVALEGYEVQEQIGQVTVKLYWRALTGPKADYSVFVHILQDSEVVAQSDSPPVNGRLPTYCWVPREVVEDVHILAVDEQRPYQILVGLYDWRTGQRLPVQPPIANQAIPLELNAP